MYKHILITTDGSELAEKGIDHGLALAKAVGAKVSIVTVTVPLTGFALEGVVYSGAIDNYDAAMQQETHKLSASCIAKAKQLGVSTDFISETSEVPAQAILETAEKLGCDLIVMSSHGRHGLNRLILGSQTAKVIAEADRPVLVVR